MIEYRSFYYLLICLCYFGLNMKDDKERITIIELHESGMNNSDIVRAAGFGRIKVQRVVKPL